MARRIELPLAVALTALFGCDAIESGRQPLTVVEKPQPEGEKPQPQGGGPAGASGGQVVTGGGVQTPGEAACWTAKLPAEPVPPAPRLTVDEACRLGANASRWTVADSPGADTFGHNNDHRGDMVGRWVRCGGDSLMIPPHDGVEFGGNGRWRALVRDQSGALVPATPAASGYYYLLGTGQLDLVGESLESGTRIYFAKFADGNPDVLSFQDTGLANQRDGLATYARVAAAPDNGADNFPSVSDGRCSMVGDWDVPANEPTPTAPASTWSFDGRGNFVVGPRGAVTCDEHNMHGTYRLSAREGFQLTTGWNLGLCDWWFAAQWPASFDASCQHLTLTQKWDNCTGGRGYLNGTTVLTRVR